MPKHTNYKFRLCIESWTTIITDYFHLFAYFIMYASKVSSYTCSSTRQPLLEVKFKLNSLAEEVLKACINLEETSTFSWCLIPESYLSTIMWPILSPVYNFISWCPICWKQGASGIAIGTSRFCTSESALSRKKSTVHMTCSKIHVN